MRQDNGNRGARLCLETHEFHNYCIMLQEGAIPGRLPACLSARLPVCLPALAALPACSTPTFVVKRARARANEHAGWGRKVRLRRGLCNPSLSGASPSSFRPSFYFFLAVLHSFLLSLSHPIRAPPLRLHTRTCTRSYCARAYVTITARRAIIRTREKPGLTVGNARNYRAANAPALILFGWTHV